MVWNTIVHPRMMHPSESTPITLTMTPIKFADTHKLSFYDAIVSTSSITFDPSTATTVDRAYTLIKGDFETLKNMILKNEAVCVAGFISVPNGSQLEQQHADFAGVRYISDKNVIALVPDNSGDAIYLHSDNTITNSLTSPDPNPDPGTSAA